MMHKLPQPWSYSQLKRFENCPKQYYHVTVAKDVKEKQTEALTYGNELHKAAELYVKSDTPLPGKFKFMQAALDRLKIVEGDKLAEVKLGVAIDGMTSTLQPCGFFDKDVWWRGLADLVIINGNMAYSIDYKTGKNAKYSEDTQLDLVAAGLFLKFPKVEVIKSAYLYVASNEMPKKTHYVEKQDSYFEAVSPTLERMVNAYENNQWGPNPGPLCGYCPVTQCEYNRR